MDTNLIHFINPFDNTKNFSLKLVEIYTHLINPDDPIPRLENIDLLEQDIIINIFLYKFNTFIIIPTKGQNYLVPVNRIYSKIPIKIEDRNYFNNNPDINFFIDKYSVFPNTQQNRKIVDTLLSNRVFKKTGLKTSDNELFEFLSIDGKNFDGDFISIINNFYTHLINGGKFLWNRLVFSRKFNYNTLLILKYLHYLIPETGSIFIDCQEVAEKKNNFRFYGRCLVE